MTLDFLSPKERISLELEDMYSKFGFCKYKVNRFEEYSFYMEKANFLSDKRILTFSDGHGRLMALKPDITLSIVKNSLKSAQTKHKIYYNETVFRTPKGEEQFKEIHQIGVEYIGKQGDYQTLEILNLAAKSLHNISQQYRLCLSNTALLLLALEQLPVNPEQKSQIILYMSQKNAHDLKKYLLEENIPGELCLGLMEIPVSLSQGIPELKRLFAEPVYQEVLGEFVATLENLRGFVPEEMLFLDFSHIPSTEYYRGLVFSGYIQGLSMPVLSGGRYDRLLQQMGSELETALGFAVDLSSVEKLFPKEKVETLELEAKDSPVAMLQQANELYAQGKTFSIE